MKLATIREALLAEADDEWEVAVDTDEMLALVLADAKSGVRSNVVCTPVPAPAGDDFAVPSTAMLLGSESPAGSILGHQLVIDDGDGLELAQELLWLGDSLGCVRIVATTVAEGHRSAAGLVARVRGLAVTTQGGEVG